MLTYSTIVADIKYPRTITDCDEHETNERPNNKIISWFPSNFVVVVVIEGYFPLEKCCSIQIICISGYCEQLSSRICIAFASIHSMCSSSIFFADWMLLFDMMNIKNHFPLLLHSILAGTWIPPTPLFSWSRINCWQFCSVVCHVNNKWRFWAFYAISYFLDQKLYFPEKNEFKESGMNFPPGRPQFHKKNHDSSQQNTWTTMVVFSLLSTINKPLKM